MAKLKLTSIRIPESSLDSASELSTGFWHFTSSDIIRIAIWVGLKVLYLGTISQLAKMMWEEETKGKCFTLEDVLRTAGVLKENKHGAGL